MTRGDAHPGALMARLRRAGVTLQVRGDRLAWSAPSGVMTASVMAELQAAKPEVIAALRSDDGGWMPLSAAQERLYIMERLRPGRSDLNVPAAMHARGDVDEAALSGALDSLLARHEALRFVFAVDADGGAQRVSDVAHVPVEFRDVPSGIEAMAAAIDEARRPFDLSMGPMLRAVVLRITQSDRLVVFTFHHLTCDEPSLRIALREVVTLYTQHARGLPAHLPPPRKQYSDYIAAELSDGHDSDDDVSFWRHHLAGVRPRPSVSDGSAAYATKVEASGDARARLSDLAQTERTTLFAAVFTAYAIALGTQVRDDDVVVGIPSSNRRSASFDDTVGSFVNTLAVRASPGSEPTFRKGLRAVRRTLLDAMAHARLPFDRVVTALRPQRGSGELFDAWLVLRHAVNDVAIEGLELDTIDLEFAVARHALKLDLSDGRDGLYGTLVGRSPTWEPPAVDRLAARVTSILASAGELADLPMGEFRDAVEQDATQHLQRDRARVAESARARLRSARRTRA